MPAYENAPMPIDPASTLIGAGPLGAFCLILLYQIRELQRELAQVSQATAEANKELAEAIAGFRGWMEGRLDP